jgi:hypothetical protein
VSIVDLLQRSDAGGTRCRIEVYTESIASLEEVKRKLESFGGDGWVCFTDGWKWTKGGKEERSASTKGSPLSAELCGEGRSAQLRYDGDRWQWVVIEEKQCDAGEEAWAFEESLVSSVGDKMRMRYRVYWKRDGRADGPVRPFRPFAARMLGWVNEISEEEN